MATMSAANVNRGRGMPCSPIFFDRRHLLQLVTGMALGTTGACGPTDRPGRLTFLKCGVGPYFPTPGENRKQFDPLFQELGGQIGLPAEVTVADDWIGIAEALRSGTLDL